MMKRISWNFGGLLLAASLLLFSSPLLAQLGYSNAGLAVSKQRARAGTLPKAEEVIVEEFMNYHRHALPIPDQAERVHLDLQIAAGQQAGEAIFQVGISTAFLQGLEGAAPLNLALVVDRSGSMQQEQRMEKAREAINALISQLRWQDRVSLIAFDDVVEVLYPSQPVGNAFALRQAVAQLQPRGSTDLMSGIAKGYEVVLQHYQPRHTQRLIILTDAIANTGTTDPAAIARKSVSYQGDWQVDCAMICVGSGFQHNLARTVSKHGNNSLHFIDDSEDLQKVFVNEIQSLLAPLAREVRLDIRLQGAEWQEVYGYEAPQTSSRWNLALNDFNYGLTQVVMGKVQPTRSHGYRNATLEARLTYFDYQDQTRKELVQQVPIGRMQQAMSPDLAKTYGISLMAQALKASADHFQAQRTIQAQQLLREALADQQQLATRAHFSFDEPDSKRVRDILQSDLTIVDEYLVDHGWKE
jgi:Ca-activated chloride channel family protein